MFIALIQRPRLLTTGLWTGLGIKLPKPEVRSSFFRECWSKDLLDNDCPVRLDMLDRSRWMKVDAVASLSELLRSRVEKVIGFLIVSSRGRSLWKKEKFLFMDVTDKDLSITLGQSVCWEIIEFVSSPSFCDSVSKADECSSIGEERNGVNGFSVDRRIFFASHNRTISFSSSCNRSFCSISKRLT